MNYLATVAFALHSSMHHVMNYEPLMLLISHKCKLPSECTQYEEDVLKNPDFTDEEIELLSQTVTGGKLSQLGRNVGFRCLLVLMQI